MKLSNSLLILSSLFIASGVTGAEIRLKSEAYCTKTLVALSDIAEIVPAANDPASLGETVLFAAPVSGDKRTLDVVELRDLLSRIGIDSIRHRLTGARSVTVTGGGSSSSTAVSSPVPKAKATTPAGHVSSQLVTTLESEVAEALTVYLNARTSETRPWTVTLKLSIEQAQALATGGQIKDISGGSAPWTGLQSFEIRMQRHDVFVEATVVLPQQAVVLKRSLSKGTIIAESDVMLQTVDSLKNDNYCVDPSEVVGQETTGSIREGSVLTSGSVRRPTWVRKGDIVTVRSMNNGIVVRTEGTALCDGVRGDTIPVEAISTSATGRGKRNKQENPTYLARVCDPKTVEINATPISVEN